jgi:hypothetical protein
MMENITSEHYPFEPLNPPSSQIRLGRFQRDRSGSIIGWLENYSIDDPKRPEFKALSYVWGAGNFSYKIAINGHLYLALESLSPALSAICDDVRLKRSWWWIDCICINQGVDERAPLERNAQVNMMDKIYEKAEEVVGWLGQGDIECERGMRFSLVLSEVLPQLRAEGLVDFDKLDDDLKDPKNWSALEKLFLQPWWTRVWTLQEYVVAKRFTFRYGKEKASRTQLNKATLAIDMFAKIKDTIMSSRAFQAAWVRRRMWGLYQRKIPLQLTGLLAYVGDSKASDPRDRIYSLLGLAKDRYLAEPPNYQDDVRKVYIGFVKSFVQHYNNLDVICFVDRFHHTPTEGSSQSSLPSWVPDWRVAVIPGVVPLMVSQTASHYVGNCRPSRITTDGAISYTAGLIKGPLEATFSDDSRILILKGIMLDYVDGVGGLKIVHEDRDGDEAEANVVYEAIPSTSPVNALARNGDVSYDKNDVMDASMLLEQIGRCLLLNRKDRYLKVESPVGYRFDEFQALCLTAMNTPGAAELNPRFLDWFQRNKDLQIQGHSLERICTLTPKLEKSKAIKLDDIFDQDSFVSRFTDTTRWMVRRLMTTNSGNIGVVSGRAQKGDQIWVLLGCSVPVVLRKRDGEQSCEVIGECYLQGYMQGEIMEELRKGAVNIEEVRLS